VRSLALAPETGCEPLRAKLGKKLADDYIVDKLGDLARVGITRLKLYFLLGLPEAGDDPAQIVSLVRRLVAAMRQGAPPGKRVELTVVLNPFLAKAGTHWQRRAISSLSAWREDSSLVKKGLSRLAGVRVKAKASRGHLCQAILSRAGEEIWPAMVNSVERGESLERAMTTVGLDPQGYLAEQKGELPWNFIN
jgi:hypothetical protein